MQTTEIGFGDSKSIVSRLGFGCMSLVPDSYKPGDDEPPIDGKGVLIEAHKLGMRFWDTSDMYAKGKNEELIGTVWDEVKREEVILATKCGITRSESDPRFRGVDNSEKYVMEACDASLERLKTDYIDVFYLHRKDPAVDIEVPMRAMKRLVDAGKIKHVGLCEVDADTLRRAHAVHPVSVVQVEFSLLTQGPGLALLSVCEELGIKIVAYSPISRGLLSSATPTFFPEGDARSKMPRFTGENLAANAAIAAKIAAIAEAKGCTSAQICLAYLLHKSPLIIPIPGTKSVSHLASNAGAVDVELTAEDMTALEEAAPVGAAQGDRYNKDHMARFGLKK